jgi:hypothetical protein
MARIGMGMGGGDPGGGGPENEPWADLEREAIRAVLRRLAEAFVALCSLRGEGGRPVRHELAGEIEMGMRHLLDQYRQIPE